MLLKEAEEFPLSYLCRHCHFLKWNKIHVLWQICSWDTNGYIYRHLIHQVFHSLRSKRFCGVWEQRTGFLVFCPRGKWGESQKWNFRTAILCSRTSQKRLLRRLGVSLTFLTRWAKPFWAELRFFIRKTFLLFLLLHKAEKILLTDSQFA